MKKHALATLIGGLFLSATSMAAPQQEYLDEMNQMFEMMRDRVEELREYASDENNVITETVNVTLWSMAVVLKSTHELPEFQFAVSVPQRRSIPPRFQVL